MTGYTIQVNQFDSFITTSYNSLKNDAQRICWNESDYNDILNDTIIKCRERIVKSGITNTNFYGFVWASIINAFKNKKKIKRVFCRCRRKGE